MCPARPTGRRWPVWRRLKLRFGQSLLGQHQRLAIVLIVGSEPQGPPQIDDRVAAAIGAKLSRREVEIKPIVLNSGVNEQLKLVSRPRELLLSFGKAKGDAGYNGAADCNQDEVVGAPDLGCLLTAWTASPGPSGRSCASLAPLTADCPDPDLPL